MLRGGGRMGGLIDAQLDFKIPLLGGHDRFDMVCQFDRPCDGAPVLDHGSADGQGIEFNR